MLKWNTVGIIVAGAFMVFAQSALAAGDVENGKKVYKKCAACHSLEEGKKKVGPTLYGVFGRTSGQLEGFKFSKALVAAEIVWDETTIDAYIADPKGYIPKNRMAFAGLKKEQDRADVIAYIKENAQ